MNKIKNKNQTLTVTDLVAKLEMVLLTECSTDSLPVRKSIFFYHCLGLCGLCALHLGFFFLLLFKEKIKWKSDTFHHLCDIKGNKGMWYYIKVDDFCEISFFFN